VSAKPAKKPPARRPPGDRRPRALPQAQGSPWLAVGVITLVWAVLFLPQLTGKVFTLGDASAYRAFAEFSRARFAAGQGATHWNPFVFLGLPASASLADPRPQWLPGPLLAAWDAITHAAPLLPVLFALLAGALAAAFLARVLWRCGAAAMAIAGLAWLCAPALLVPLAFGHDAEAFTLGLMPVALLAVHHLFAAADDAAARRAALALAGVLALAGLGGHPQFAAYSVLFAAAFACERAFTHARVQRLPLLLVVLLAAAAMSSAVWLPAWEYGRESVRASAELMQREADTFRAGGRDLLSTLWPHAAGFGGSTYFGGMQVTDYPRYFGMLFVLLAGVALLDLARPARAAAMFLGGVVVLGALAALGTHGPLGALLASLPGFSMFRTSITWLVLAQLAAALLAARGFAALERAPARVLLVLGVVAAAIAAFLLAQPANPLTDAFAAAMVGDARHAQDPGWAAAVRSEPVTAVFDLGGRLVLLALALLMLAATRGGARRAIVGAALVVLIAAGDLTSVALPVLRQSTGERARLAPPPPSVLAQAAVGDSLHRAFPQARGEFFSNAWVSWRTRQVAGLHGAAPQRWNDLRTSGLLAAPGFERAIGARYWPASGGPPLDDSQVDTLASGVRVLRSALPRVYAVVSVQAFASEDSVIAAMKDPAFEPSQVVVTSDASIARAYYSSDDADVVLTRDDPDAQTIRVKSQGDVFVVIADLFMPGWSATIDGHRAHLACVDHALRGIAVPPGAHEVRLSYTPPGWAAGRIVALLAWALWLLAIATTTLRPARPTQPARPEPTAPTQA
jgi:hypothetical protein